MSDCKHTFLTSEQGKYSEDIVGDLRVIKCKECKTILGMFPDSLVSVPQTIHTLKTEIAELKRKINNLNR